jgi:hypothetical protein
LIEGGGSLSFLTPKIFFIFFFFFREIEGFVDFDSVLAKKNFVNARNGRLSVVVSKKERIGLLFWLLLEVGIVWVRV